MLAILTEGRYGTHASNLGAIVGARIAALAGVRAYIVDPGTVDELEPAARLTGLPDIPRRSIWHALNQKAVARAVAARIGLPYSRARLVVAHLGGGISVAAHRHGKAIDVNNALEGEGPFAVERSGGLPATEVARLARSMPEDALLRKISGAGGVVAHLGTNDMPEVLRRARGGDAAAHLVLKALVRQVAREIGACATVLQGRVDAVVLCGGLAHCRPLTRAIGRHVRFLAPIHVVPGEREMEALALGVLRVLRGEERARSIGCA
jgi:butyrate kinase